MMCFQVAELLVKHGAVVNVADLWKFTPLHEAAAKGKYEICKLLLKHGADPLKKNRDGNAPLDLVKEGDTDIQVSFDFKFHSLKKYSVARFSEYIKDTLLYLE